MHRTRRPADELLEVLRALLLLQGAVLVATTIEALFWSLVFPGAAGTSLLLSGAAAVSVLVARARLGAGRPRTRRVLYVIETGLLVTLVIDLGLAVALTGAVPPIVALITRFVLPLAVIALLRRAARATVASVAVSPPVAVGPLEALS